MLFFNKKQPEKALSLGKGSVPMDKARELSSKGFTEPEIINLLRNDGYSAEEIDKALMQVMKSGIAEGRPEMMQMTQPKQENVVANLPTLEDVPQQRIEMPVVPETTLPPGYYYPADQDNSVSEDYVNSMINQKFREVEQRMTEFSIKSKDIDRKIGQISDEIGTLAQTKPGDQQLLLAKMDGMKDTIDEVDTRLGSLERAFKETLPALIESVRALSDLVQRLKREAA
jgi:hypothetical protein